MAFVLFLVVLAAGITFLAWQIHEGKIKLPDGLLKKPAVPAANPSPVTPSAPPQATPDPLIQTPVGPQVASTAAFTDASRPSVNYSSQVDSTDRNSRVLGEIGGWRRIRISGDRLDVPNAHGYLMIDAAEPDADISILLYEVAGVQPVVSVAGSNMVTLQYPNANGDYYIVLGVSKVSGAGTVNRKGA